MTNSISLQALIARRGPQREADVVRLAGQQARHAGQQPVGRVFLVGRLADLRQQARTLDGAAVLEQQVDVEAIAPIRGHAAGGGVRLADEALLFEPRQDVPDGGRRHAQRPAACDDDRGHGLAAVDVLADHRGQDAARTSGEVGVGH